VLLDNNGGQMRNLNSYELAQCAAAAAAMQDALRRQQQQQQQQQLLLSAARQQSSEGDALEPSNALLASNALQTSTSSSSSSGALALLDPLQQFWQLLHHVTMPQLSTFSVDSLALTALSFAAAGKNSRELTLGVVNAALARPQKWWESPVAVSRMLKALVLTDTQHEVGGCWSSGGVDRELLILSCSRVCVWGGGGSCWQSRATHKGAEGSWGKATKPFTFKVE
jgi:hypothetical protein